MSEGIAKTIHFLTQSRTQAATDLLRVAMNSTYEPVRRLAGEKVVLSKVPTGMAEIIRGFDSVTPQIKALLETNRDGFVSSLRQAIFGTDATLRQKALRILETEDFFELLPHLINITVEENSDRHSDLIQAATRLMERYVHALESDANRFWLHETILSEVVNVLTSKLQKAGKSNATFHFDIFVQIFPFLNAEHQNAYQFLNQPAHSAFVPFRRYLLTRQFPAVYDYIFSGLTKAKPAPLFTNTFAKRDDVPFLNEMFQRMTDEQLPASVIETVAKTPTSNWLSQLCSHIHEFSEDAQAGVLILTDHWEISPQEKRNIITEVFRSGKPKGRLIALKSLVAQPSELTDQLILQATHINDTEIQIFALQQLRQRIPSQGLARAIELLKTGDPYLCDAIRDIFPEFRFLRFMELFDGFENEQRRNFFAVVRSLDPNINVELRNLLLVGTPAQKAKALFCVEIGELVLVMEDQLEAILANDPEEPLRNKAAELLAAGKRQASRNALVHSMHRDASERVRNTAKASLANRHPHGEVP